MAGAGGWCCCNAQTISKKSRTWHGQDLRLRSEPSRVESSHSPKSIVNVDGFGFGFGFDFGFGLFMPSVRPSLAIEFDIVLDGAQVPGLSPPPWPPIPSAMKVNCHLHLYPCE